MKTSNQTFVRLMTGVVAVLAIAGWSIKPAVATILPPATGLQAWYQADTGVLTDGSGNVSNWTDQASAGGIQNATQTTVDNRPALSTANIGLRLNVPVITFGGTGASTYDQLNLPSIDQASGGGATVYFLINNDADANASPNKNWLNRSDASAPAIYGNPNGFGASAVGFYAGNWHAQSGGVTGWKVVRASWVNGASGNYQTFMTNFTAGASASEASFGPSITGDWVSIGSTGSGQHTFSSFAEILIYNQALSVEENQQVLDYFYQEYWTIPEPSTVLLFGLGGLVLWKARRRLRK